MDRESSEVHLLSSSSATKATNGFDPDFSTTSSKCEKHPMIETSFSSFGPKSNNSEADGVGGVGPWPGVSLRPHRLFSKGGQCNVTLKHVPSLGRRYLTDFFTTVIDMRWRYNIVFYLTAFISTWVVFGLIWWFIAFLHGEDHEDYSEESEDSCVANVTDFITGFLFSLETQQAIGYGDRVIGTRCVDAVVLFLIQSLIGVCTECIVMGLIFVKLSRPKSRGQTIVFSRRAVVCFRNGGYCLQFRVGDIRRSHFVQTNLRAILVRSTTTEEGETIPLCQFSMELEIETIKNNDFVFLAWPVTVIHRITESSPLWEVSKEDLEMTRMEVVVIMEGIVELSGKNLQVRTSYLHSEILWGSRHSPLVTYRTGDGKNEIDFSAFHNTFPVPMPIVSARMFAENTKLTDIRETENSSEMSEEEEEPFDPMTFAPIDPGQYNKKTVGYKFATAWKRWRRVKPLSRGCFQRTRR